MSVSPVWSQKVATGFIVEDTAADKNLTDLIVNIDVLNT